MVAWVTLEEELNRKQLDHLLHHFLVLLPQLFQAPEN